MKKYELLKSGNKWELYFLDNEFKEWHFIRSYKEDELIKNIYEEIKNTYKDLNYNILIKYSL